MSLAELTPAQKEELVVSLSALLLQDSGVDMSAENLEAVIKVGVCVYVCMWGDGGLSDGGGDAGPLFSYFIMITRRESTTMYLHNPLPFPTPHQTNQLNPQPFDVFRSSLLQHKRTPPTNATHNPNR